MLIYSLLLPLLWGGATSQPASAPSPQDLERAAALEGRLQQLLLRDLLLQNELKLAPQQRKAVNALMDETDGPVWRLRDLPVSQRNEKLAPILDRFEASLATLLKPPQRQRLAQLVLQYRGPVAVLDPPAATQLALSDEQQGQIRALLEKTRPGFERLTELARAGRSREELDTLADRLRKAEAASILAILTTQQRQQWAELLGPRFHFVKVRPLALRAPELRAAETWLNGPPLTLAGLRGSVVMIHFYAFRCGNCQANFPHYKSWQAELAPKGLNIIGIHTPEVADERDPSAVAAEARKHGLNFPILVDNSNENWDAWGNNVWPAVYLIDRKGYVRYWWYGELNWKGAAGEKFMRARITELLAEKP